MARRRSHTALFPSPREAGSGCPREARAGEGRCIGIGALSRLTAFGGSPALSRKRERGTAERGERAMTTPILQLLNVESNYGPVQALRGVSLSVAEGKIVTVLGANGAGKTTTLKTISGIIDPLKGQVKFRGEEIQGSSPDAIVRAGIVHVPEGREVFPLLSVEDNLRMGAYTRSDADGVAQDLEAVFGYFPILRERAKQEAGQLSGGQQQMLAIARALLARPALDPDGRAEPWAFAPSSPRKSSISWCGSTASAA